MKLLIEYNAFESVGKFFRNNSQKTESDINELLQICIQSIFFEKINLSEYVPLSIKENSREIINQLSKIGFDNFSIIENSDKDIWNTTCNRISETLSKELKYIVKESELDKSAIPQLSEELNFVVDNVTNALNNGDERKFSYIIEKISDVERYDSLIEVLARKDDLFYKLLEFKGKWNKKMTIKIISECRTNQNFFTADLSKLYYAPSVKRAAQDERVYQLFANKINEIIKQYGHECYKMKLPSVADYLILSSRGDRNVLIDETLKLREAFSQVREHIYKADPFEDILVMERLNEIAEEVVANKLNKKNVSKNDSFVIGTQVGFTTEVRDYSILSRLIQENAIQPDIKCFTEITKRIANKSYEDRNINRYKEMLYSF